MRVLRTPKQCFANLPDYPFAPHYAEVDGLRVHYLDEGPREAAPVLLMHGEPSWSYLDRKMIPILAEAGHRAIAPDLVGFGRSDKPAQQSDYSYQRHIDWMRGLLFDQLNLRDITFFGQDWGGLIGLRLVADEPERFARGVVGNTGLPTGDMPMPEAFLRWQEFARTANEFDIGRIVQNGTMTELPDDVVAAYNAPFPDDSYKAGARIFPSLVPTSPEDPAAEPNRQAWKALGQFTKPLLTAFSDSDPITRGGFVLFQGGVPGAEGQPHVTIEGAGHFLQEDKGEELAQVIVDFIARTS